MTLSEPVPDEHAPYTDATRARMALAAAAQELSDSARKFVPIWPGSLHTAGGADVSAADVEDAARLVARAEEVLERMVVFAAVAGAPWGEIGDGLGTARQNAHKKYRDAVARFRADLAEPEGVQDDGTRYLRLEPAAHDPDAWAPRLDAWVERHREPADYLRAGRAVSDGLARLHPHMELMQLQGRRRALLDEHLVPPAEQVLPIAERELVLWQQMGEAGHDVAYQVERMQRQIAELRATLPGSADSEPGAAESSGA